MPAIADFMVRITGNDRGSNDAFEIQLSIGTCLACTTSSMPADDAVAAIPAKLSEPSPVVWSFFPTLLSEP